MPLAIEIQEGWLKATRYLTWKTPGSEEEPYEPLPHDPSGG